MRKKLLIITISALIFAAIPGAKTTDAADQKYEKSTKDLNLVCAPPCKYNKRLFNKTLKIFTEKLQSIEKNLQLKIPQGAPVQVHIGFDSVCQEIFPEYANNYPKGIVDLYRNKTGRAIICLNDPLERTAKGLSSFDHEIAHLYYYIRSYDYANDPTFEEIFASYTAGWTPQAEYTSMKKVCDAAAKSTEHQSFCDTGYDLRLKDIPLLVRFLDAKRKKDGYVLNDYVWEVLEKLLTDLPD